MSECQFIVPPPERHPHSPGQVFVEADLMGQVLSIIERCRDEAMGGVGPRSCQAVSWPENLNWRSESTRDFGVIV